MTDFFQSYLFLRTFSIQLQLSPFEPDAFASCLDSIEHNALSDEIHSILLKACIHNIKDDISCAARWSTLDHFTWTEYILPILNCYRLYYMRTCNKDINGEEALSEVLEITDVIKVIKDNNRKGISYISYPAVGKLLILKCLTTLLLSNENFRQLTDFRAQIEQTNGDINVHTDKGNSLPLFPKGDDGFPEECILCGQGGDLLCCDMCPAVYHQSCLNTNPSDMEDNWACYECSTIDPMNSRLRLPILKAQKMSISFIGRFIIQNFGKERSDGKCYRLLGFKAICKLINGLNAAQMSSYPWINYRSALARAQQYGQYQNLNKKSCHTSKQSSLVFDKMELLKITRLIALFDTVKSAFDIPIDVKECSEEVDDENSQNKNIRSSARLTILDNAKAEEVNKLLSTANNLQLEYVFNPNSYNNRYSNMKTNVYLGTCVRQEDSHSHSNGKQILIKEDDNISLSAIKSVKYNSSKFSNLGPFYKILNDNKIRIKDSDKISNNKDVIDVVATQFQPLTSLSTQLNSINSNYWPLYGFPPVRSVCRFLEAMHLALGSLCITKLTNNLQRPQHKKFFRRKRRETNKDRNESNENKNNMNGEEDEDVKENKSARNFSSLPWIHRLSLCDDLEHLKALVLEMVHSINPCAFWPSWYMTIEESLHEKNISQKKKDTIVSTGTKNALNSTGISSFDGRFWIGRHPKNGTVRFPTFLKLIDAWQEYKIAKLNSNDDDDDDDDEDSDDEEEEDDDDEVNDDVVVVGSKDSKESNISDKNEKKGMKNTGEEKEEEEYREEVEDVSEGKVVDVDGDDDDDDADGNDKDNNEQKPYRNSHHTPRLYSFSYHKKNISRHLRACVPSKLLKRIARLGGSAFVPFVIYPKCPISFPSPPFSWIWIHQLRNCQFIESVALQLRILEGHLKLQELPMGILDFKVQNEVPKSGRSSDSLSPFRASWDVLEEVKNRGMFLMDPAELHENSSGSATEKGTCNVRTESEVLTLPLATAPMLTPSVSSSSSLNFNYTSSYSSSSSSFPISSSSSSTSCPCSSTITPQPKALSYSPSFPSSTCWYSSQHGDVICFSAANSKLQHQHDPVHSSHYASCTPLRSIASFPQNSNFKEFWGYYNHAIRKYLRNWQSKFSENKNSPYVLYRDKIYTGEATLPVACIHNFQNRVFLSELLSKYRYLLTVYGDEIPLFQAEKTIRILGEFADSVLDIIMEGGSLITDSDEVQGMGLGDVVIHSTLLEEIKSVQKTTITALSTTSTSTLTELSSFSSVDKKKRRRGEVLEKRNAFGKQSEEISSVNNTIFDDICTKIVLAVSATLKYQIMTTPHTKAIDTKILTDSNFGTLRSKVQDILTPHSLPIPQDSPQYNFYPLLADPTAKYLKSTTSFSTSFTAISLLSIVLSTPEKFLQTVFRIRFFKSVNKKRELPCPYQCGVVYRRKLNITELPYVVRTRSLSFIRNDDDEKASTYVPQVGDELLYYPLGHQQHEAAYPDICKSIPGLNKRRRGHYVIPDSEGLPDWIACRVVTIDFEFPSSDVNASILTSTSNDDVINGLVMVLQLTPLHLSHSKSKDRNEEDGNIENKGTNKSSPVFSLKRTFFVLYRPGHNSPEFLLRRRQICQCLAKTWHIAPHTQAQELELHSKEIPSTHDLRRTVSCNRRFSCTYDNGDVYSGVVLRVTRDLQGIPLWSGAAVVWDSEAEAAALDNREVMEDFLNEWELEPEIPRSNDDVQIIEEENEEKLADETVECTKKENGGSKVKKHSKSRSGKRRSSKKSNAIKSRQESKPLIKAEADDSDEDNDVENFPELKMKCDRKVEEVEEGIRGGEGGGEHAHEMVLGPNRDPNHQKGRHDIEAECKVKGEMCDAMRVVDMQKIVEYDLKLEVGAGTEVKREKREVEANGFKSEEKIRREEEEVLIVGEEHMSLEALSSEFQEVNHSDGFNGGSSGAYLKRELRSVDYENNDKDNVIVADDDNDINGNSNSDNPSNSNEHSSYRSRMERKKSMNKSASEQALLVSNTLPHLLPSRSPPPPLPPPPSLPVLPILSTKHLSDLSNQFINYMLLHLAEHFLSLSEFEAFADRIDPNIAPGYDLIIPVNIHLTLMKKRAECCYYRNPHSFLSDARHLYLNAVHYNNDDSPIALRAAELYRAVLRALRWCFVAEDFRDFICFDACLRDMVGISSISSFSGITVTAAIDQYRSASVEEIENENENMELDNETEIVLIDDDDDDDDEDDVEEEDAEEEEEEVKRNNGIRIKRKYKQRIKKIEDQITSPKRRKSRRKLGTDITNNNEDNNDNNYENDGDVDESKNDNSETKKSDKDDGDEDDDEVEKDKEEEEDDVEEEDAEEEEEEVKRNNGIRIKRKYKQRIKKIEDQITSPKRRKSRRKLDADSTSNNEDNNDNRNDKNENCSSDKDIDEDDSDDDEIYLYLTDDRNERKSSTLQNQHENENKNKNENKNENANEGKNDVEVRGKVEILDVDSSDTDDEVIILNSPNIKKKKKEDIVIRRCSLRLKE